MIEHPEIPPSTDEDSNIKKPPSDWQADVSIHLDAHEEKENAGLGTWIENPSAESKTAIDTEDEQKSPLSDWQADVSVHTEEQPQTVESEQNSVTNIEEAVKEPPLKEAKAKKQKIVLPPLTRKVISVEGFVTIAVLIALFFPVGYIMGFSRMMQTLFNNGLNLLLNTCFYLLAVSVIIGALTNILSEFGTVSIFNKALAPLMKPIYGMPGATSMAIFSSFMSDNPAVLTLASDRKYRRYFKKYQLATLTNIGTSFGMGLVVVALMMTVETTEGNRVLAIIMGVVGTLIGSVISTRLMLRKNKKLFGTTEEAEPSDDNNSTLYREIREGGIGQRLISSLLDGGAEGVKTGFSIIPGVLIIANIILLLTNGKPAGGYTGAAGEGIGLIPLIGESLNFIFKYLFGFTNSSSISIPLTALGSAGAAIGILDRAGAVFTANELAVFTAMCMFWSGYLSTHVAMMDGTGFRKLTGWSILYHTIAGLIAGISANYLYQLFYLIL